MLCYNRKIMGTLRHLNTTRRLGILARLAGFLRLLARPARPVAKSEPAPDDDGFVDITDKLLAMQDELHRRYPDPPKSLEEFRKRHKPVPADSDFLKNRPGVLDIRDGVVRLKNGKKINTDRLLNSRREKANSGE